MANWLVAFQCARSAYLKAQCHIEGEPRYRYYPLYSALLVAFHIGIYYWPIDVDVLMLTIYNQRWLLLLRGALEQTSLWLALFLGMVGLLRRPVLAKLLSVFGVLGSIQLLSDGGFSALPGRAWTEAMWYLLDLPEKLIVRLGDGNSQLETLYWSIYLFLLWLLARPILKRCWKYFVAIERILIVKWPRLSQLNAPLL